MTKVQEAKDIFEKIMVQMKKRIVGNENVIELMFASLLSEGHVLLEGVPGIAKTLMASTLAEVIEMGFKRIQFTSDLMPADITGGNIYERETSFIRKSNVQTSRTIYGYRNPKPYRIYRCLSTS